jgi:hypothetical protein
MELLERDALLDEAQVRLRQVHAGQGRCAELCAA